MTKKKVLVLGASIYQLDTIIKAKNLGYEVITTDNIPDNPGHKLADKSYNISTTDREGVFGIALREKIDGIISPCTDVAVPSLAYVAADLGLPGPPVNSAEIVTHKIEFRDFLVANKLPVPEFYEYKVGFEVNELFRDGFKWVIKPDYSSGSKGVFVLSSEEEFSKYLSQSLSFSLSGKCIIERYIEGFQGTCDGFLKNGELKIALITERQMAPYPYTATWGHLVPADLSTNLKDKLLLTLKEVWNILGVLDGPFDADFVVSNDTIYLLELSPRIGGNSIPKLIKESIGFDIIECSLRYVVEDDSNFKYNEKVRPTAVILLGIMEHGHLFYNKKGFESLFGEDWVVSLSMDLDLKDEVRPFINGRNRVGEVIITGRDREDLLKKRAVLERRLELSNY